MKILIAANIDDGLYIFRRDLILRLIGDGHEVTVSVPCGDYRERLAALGCSVIDTEVDRRGISARKDLSLLRTYFRLLKTERPELVITYTVKPNVYCGLAARLKRIPYAINITGLGSVFEKKGPVQLITKLLYRVGCRGAKVIFTENAEIRDRLVSMKLFRKERLVVLHGAGVNTEHFGLSPYPEKKEPIRFYFSGRIMREKGILEFLEAADRLIADGENAEFWMSGYYEEDDLKKVVEEHTADPRFVHTGWIDDVRPVIGSCHCFVLPSWHEGMANTLLECGAMGRPLITSSIHGCMEAVEEGKNGFLHEVRSADSLYRAMKRFLALPYEEKAEMGRYSREFIVRNFDKKQVVEETAAALYRGI